MDDGNGKGGLRAAFLFFLFAVTVLAGGKHYQYTVGFLRLAVFFTAAYMLWRRRADPLSVSPYFLLLAGYGVLAVGHAFSSVYVWVSLQHALNIVLASVLLAVAVSGGSAGDPVPWRRWLLPALSALACVEIALALSQRMATGSSRPHGTFGNPMFLSEFLAVTSLFFASRLIEERKKPGWERVAWGGGTVFLLWAALSLTESRGVAVALVPAAMTLVAARFGVRRGAKAFLLILPLLLFLGWNSVSRFFLPDVHNYGRLVFWRSALRIFASNPFGVGLGGYKYLWFTTQEPFTAAFRHYAKYPVTPHNEFLEVLTGLGFPGFILFSAALLLPLWYAARGWRGVPEERRWIAAAALAGLVLSGVNALFNFNFHEPGLIFTGALLLGVLLGSLPEPALGKRLAVPPVLVPAGAVTAFLLGLLSLSLLAGTLFLGRGEALLRQNRFDAAERAFLAASRLDPMRATVPDAISALYFRRHLAAVRESGSSPAGELLLESIRWQGKAIALCPLEQGFPFRMAKLFLERSRQSGDRKDLESAVYWTLEVNRINPYLVEGHWIRSQGLLALGRTAEAAAALEQALSIEPNFCRGYAKLAEVKEGSDPREAARLAAKAAACAESAKNRALEEGERWLLEEPTDPLRR